jgi:hypothetical protein
MVVQPAPTAPRSSPGLPPLPRHPATLMALTFMVTQTRRPRSKNFSHTLLDRVAGGFGDVLPSGGRGPADVPVGQLFGLPSRVLLESMSKRHSGFPLHRQVRPPASYGVLCSKSQRSAGLRQPGPVQVACRTWARCRSMTPGSWPLASCRWSQSPAGSGPIAMSRSRCPGIPVANRQVPYPPDGPGWPAGVRVNRGGPGESGPPEVPGLRRSLRPVAGAGRAQPWPMAWPWLSVTVRHQVDRGGGLRRWPGRGPGRGQPI